MSTKKADEKVEDIKRDFYVPAYNITVEATTAAEASEIAKKESQAREEGDA